MAGNDEEPALTVPKFSSFRTQNPSSSAPRGDGAENSVVPKFSSFKSKDSKPPAGDEGRRHHSERRRERDDEHREDRKRRHRSERERDHHESKRRRHDHHERHSSRRHRSRSPRAQSERPRKPPAHNPKAKDVKSDLFFFDTKGDPLITKYGGIERSKIPIYRRYGGGRVLGTDGRLVIHREGARDQFSLRMPGEWSGLTRDGLRVKKSYLKREGVHLRPHKVKADEEQEEEDGFLRLGKWSKHDVDEDESSEEDENRPDYRSIEGKAKAKQIIDSESSDESTSEDEVPLEQSNPLKWRSIQLNRRVKDHPEDIDAWIELVDHQDTLLRAGETLDHQVVEDEVHSFTEIKVSMLETALQQATSDNDRRRVLNYLMCEGPKVWSAKTTGKKWEELSADEERNFILWRTHLDFEMSNISTFSYGAVKRMLLDRITQALSRSEPSSRRPSDYFEVIYVFLRLTRFIHDAGFKELAVAAWQALLESTFFRPEGHDDVSTAMESLQDFWESEVPRIGEVDAQGWRHFVESGGTDEPPEPLKATPPPTTPKRTCKSWAGNESSEAKKSCLPSRTMDEGNDDDPYRVVMFSDIEPLLFLLPNHAITGVHQFLLDAFLIFCGLPPSDRSNDWTDAAWKDPFLSGARSSIPTGGSWMMSQVESEEAVRKGPTLTGLDMHSICEPETLLPGDRWFDYLNRSGFAPGSSQTWAQLTLRSLVLSAGVERLASYYLALSTLDPAISAKKTGKTLLKKFPNNPRLYKAYALAEYAQGNKEIAVKVLESATSIFKVTRASSEDSGKGSQAGLQLWQTWAWIELEAGNKALALKRLCSAFDEGLRSSSDDVEPTSTHALFARNELSMGHNDSIEGYKETRNKSYILLEYLMEGQPSTEPASLSQGNISAAMGCVDRMSSDYIFQDGQGAVHEEVLQFAARLLYLHATKG